MHEFDRCVIVDADKNPVTEGFVRSFEKGDVEIRTAKDATGWLHRGQPVQVHIYNASMGQCIYSAKVKTVHMRMVQLISAELVVNRQKRDSTRASVELDYLFRFYVDEDGTHPLEKPVQVKLLNVSAKGMCIACAERFDMGFRFAVTFRETARDIPLVVEILRREATPGGFRYGCQFTGIAEKDADEIHRWVFRQQIEQRRQQSF